MNRGVGVFLLCETDSRLPLRIEYLRHCLSPHVHIDTPYTFSHYVRASATIFYSKTAGACCSKYTLPHLPGCSTSVRLQQEWRYTQTIQACMPKSLLAASR
jgi:hypothetical protein